MTESLASGLTWWGTLLLAGRTFLSAVAGGVVDVLIRPSPATLGIVAEIWLDSGR
jgi:hypothetical protein